MDKPVVDTPFRKAVDFLLKEGDIDQDADLLPIVGLESAGALSAYISSKPSKRVFNAFIKAFPKVSKFFESSDGQSGGERISAREVINDLRADKERYIRIIEANLASINTTLTKLVDIQDRVNSDVSQSKTQHTQEDQGGRKKKILPDPSVGDKSIIQGRHDEQGSNLEEDKLDKDSGKKS